MKQKDCRDIFNRCEAVIKVENPSIYSKYDTIMTGKYGNAIVVKVYNRTMWGRITKFFGISYSRRDCIRIMYLN